MKTPLVLVKNFNKLLNYYPDDLPKQWRLDYYLNDNSALLLSRKQLPKLDWPELMESLNDLQDPFVLVVENTPLSESGKIPENIDLYHLDKTSRAKIVATDRKQGFDEMEVFFIDLEKLPGLKQQKEEILSCIQQSKKNSPCFILKTPCEFKHFADFKTLVDLLT